MKDKVRKQAVSQNRRKKTNITNHEMLFHFSKKLFSIEPYWIDMEIKKDIRYKISLIVSSKPNENSDAMLLLFDFGDMIIDDKSLRAYDIWNSKVGYYTYIRADKKGGDQLESYLLPIFNKDTKIKIGFKKWNNKFEVFFSSHITLTEDKQYDMLIKKELTEQKELLSKSHKKLLNDINLKYRYQTGEVIPFLKQEIKRITFKYKKEENNLKYKIEQLNHKINQSNQKIIDTRNTLSFRYGYALAHAFKPWYNVLFLSYTMWKIRKQFLKEKALKAAKKDSFLQNTSLDKNIETKHNTNNIPANEDQKNNFHKLDKNINDISKLRTACVMDEFTYESYAPECTLYQLTPQNWKDEIETFNPDILFIESAWRGKDDLWGNKVGHNAHELQDIILWCNDHKVPTLFYNKEDPVHFETFLTTAQQFDYVFTTDIDCIAKYKSALGHERVFLLPFAAQPKHSNPIEKYKRKDAFCFAGAYYVRYPDRTRDLSNFVSELPEFKPLEIYDRNYGKDNPDYMFPDEYKPFIVGTLKHSEIDKAYKGYNYAINLNSIKQSQSMFARRIFELLASNTTSISNFSRGIRLLFGDLVFTSDSGKTLLQNLKHLNRNPIDVKKLRLAGLRKVMQEHTYEDRLLYVVSKLQNLPIQTTLPEVALFAYTTNKFDLQRNIDTFQSQTHTHKKLYILLPENMYKQMKSEKDIIYLSIKQVKDKTLKNLISQPWISPILSKNYYGPNYLLDMILATRYTDAKVIGKSAYYFMNNKNKSIELKNENNAYNYVKSIGYYASILHHSLYEDKTIEQWLHTIDGITLKRDNIFSVDPFNYCQDVDKFEDAKKTVDDLDDKNIGINLNLLTNRAENIAPLKKLKSTAKQWDASTLSELFRTPSHKNVIFSTDNLLFDIASKFPDGKHDYIYARKDFSLEELGFTDTVKYYIETTPGLNIQIVTFFIDASGQKISHAIKVTNKNQEIEIPIGTDKIRFGLRVYAGGNTTIKSWVLGHVPIPPAEVITQSTHLLLTNHYPSYDDLYKNAFVHTRVKAYKEENINIDVFRLREETSVSYHEFENIDVITGPQEALENMIKNGKYKSILVHFLDTNMWNVLKKFVNEIDIIVWVHGAEVQPWHRRKFIYKNNQEINDAKKTSALRMDFWKSVLDPMPEKLKIITPSKYTATTMMEDIKIKIPPKQYQIIHNVIDVDRFTYKLKSPEQRKKILSIRPYASEIYANDLSVKTVLLLSKKPWFNELEFKFIGDGVLFDETLEPLRSFDNVSIERGFLMQDEIANLHKEYGIFLVPSRMDSQGVSRDEAMSSGLIPVTNNITAIPEFVDKQCAILADAEDAVSMAEGIEKLFHNPKLFLEMSENAAKRVRKQTSKKFTIQKEMELIKNG